MMKTTKLKIVRIVLGCVSGAFITAVLAAFQFWIVIYTDPGTGGFLGTPQDWAPAAAIVAGVGGFIAGAVLGIFLTAVRRGAFFGALCGGIGGLAVVICISVFGQTPPRWDTREGVLIGGLIPVGVLSGLVTSRVIRAITKSISD
jgi:hypothetical protein